MTANKVASIGGSNTDGYVLPGVNHGGGYGQAAGSKSSRVRVSDDGEVRKVTYRCADSIVLYINGEWPLEVYPVVTTLPIGNDQAFFAHSRRYSVRVIGEGHVYGWVKCSSIG